jgi:23S rRNA (cytosine1962-C5)-methyltransferase
MKTPKYGEFSNRLNKVGKHISKWARRQGITCYRVYDDDMPEFPFAIDRYEGIVHVSEYARPHGMEPDEHAAWLTGSLEVVAEVLQVGMDDIFLKFRQRQQGLRQYERFARKGAEMEVQENGLKFIINPADYLDTGLFLDHRNTRQMVRQQAEGKRVLNLFAYTGSFSVYAAAGGATDTFTIDMSATYLKWAQRNMLLNGFEGKHHRLLQADVLEWLRERPDSRWDVIVLDPPTFSNSKRMDGTLDVQRDHAWMVNAALDRLAPDGVLYFSTNHRHFKLDAEAIRAGNVKDISHLSVPEDFRNKRIHKCYCFKQGVPV